MNESHSPFSTFSTFYFTGQVSGEGLFDIDARHLRPALFTNYDDLSKLRYDFPLVFFKGGNGGPILRSLSDIVNDMLREIAPRGMEGERQRKNTLWLESEVRNLAQNGNKETLFELWQQAEDKLRAQAGENGDGAALNDTLRAAKDALKLDGDIVAYDDNTPKNFLTHAWRVNQQEKARIFSRRIDELSLKLNNILKGDSMKSAAAFGAEALKESVGTSYETAFDFESMSDILGTAFVAGARPERRWRRIRSVLSTLKSQKFFSPKSANGAKKRRKEASSYIFDHCAPAIEKFRKQLPKMVKLIKAITIAELEVEGRYKESTHDQFFRLFDERYLESDDLAMFPTYLICLRKDGDAKAEKADLVEVLSSGLPFKVLLQNHDIVEDLSIASGQFSFGLRGSQLASLALGLDGVFVLQASGAELYRLVDSVLNGLTHSGPALFNIFSGRAGLPSNSARNAPEIPLYLRAAAATESRAFPVFVHDPTGGKDWVTRVCVEGNPQPTAQWPIHRFEYEDKNLQMVSDDIAFTFVDFAAIDDRYANRFAGVSSADWQDNMIPVNEFLELDESQATGKVPYILMVDDHNMVHRAIVEVQLIQAARRCREMWRNIQKLAGINDSNASKDFTVDKEIREHSDDLNGAKTVASNTSVKLREAATEEPTSPPSDEPYIETVRCTTCDECTKINKRMFMYDDNKQAYIADLNVGTFRQLVEAAESCQVAIIHPGLPVNPDEPNLNDLLTRAEPFN